MACKGPGEEVRPLNLACAYAPSPEARPTHFTMSRCLSIFNFCLHLPLELWHRKPQEDVVRREEKLTKCDRGLTSHEVPSAPSGVCSSWKELERFFSFSPVPFMEQKTHRVKVQPETTLPFRITALSEGEGPLEIPAEVTWGREVSDALYVAGTVLDSFITVSQGITGLDSYSGYRWASRGPEGCREV